MSTHHGILLHFICSTKYRKPLIDPEWEDRLYGYIGGLLREFDSGLLRAGGVRDHIHLLIKFSPKFSVSEMAKKMKGNSSRWLNASFPSGQRFEWQRGYGVFSVSQSVAPSVSKYIDDQKEHHAKRTFKEEYLAILERHQIEFNPKYVFDEEIHG